VLSKVHFLGVMECVELHQSTVTRNLSTAQLKRYDELRDQLRSKMASEFRDVEKLERQLQVDQEQLNRAQRQLDEEKRKQDENAETKATLEEKRQQAC
jgi:Skp family chaperone for outer membrane proteins